MRLFRPSFHHLLVLTAFVVLAPRGLATSPAEEPAGKTPSASLPERLLPEEPSVTRHRLVIDGEEISYTATAGTLTLRDPKDEKALAEVFYIAYEREGVEARERRPLTFSFNGGPGSSSVWMHLGLLGPKRVVLEDDGSPVPPPYALVDNAYSLLDVTDLVFIDPVSTGYSRAREADGAGAFHGVEGDTRAVADFIRLYSTRHTRWTSPKFLIGESYGTTRAAALAGELSRQHRLNLNGIILVSAVLNFQTLRFTEGNDLPYILFLPSYTATAWHHRKLAADLLAQPLETVLAAAEDFAGDAYLRGLFAGDSLPAEARASLRRTLARFTGLSEDYLERVNLRPDIFGFTVELLRAEGRVVGRFDSRYTGLTRDRNAAHMPYDPSGEAIFSAYASTFHDYVRTDLGYETDRPYEILTRRVHPWNWGAENSFLDVGPTLADALTQQSFLRVHIDNGYFDLATPYWATHYTVDHLRLPPEARARLSMSHYTAGHMMYLKLEDLRRQKANLAAFIREASGG
jgi:carboxypeptidase C (cathepsin A)